MVHILCGGVWWLEGENGTYGASGFFIYTWGVSWFMCMDRSVKEGVRSRAYILKRFQIFYLVGCFVMGIYIYIYIYTHAHT